MFDSTLDTETSLFSMSLFPSSTNRAPIPINQKNYQRAPKTFFNSVQLVYSADCTVRSSPFEKEVSANVARILVGNLATPTHLQLSIGDDCDDIQGLLGNNLSMDKARTHLLIHANPSDDKDMLLNQASYMS